MKRYSLGFAFDAAGKRVVLIEKNRPEWQAGQLNGVGGHVEEGESFHACMAREFREETGVETYEGNWRLFARLYSDTFEMKVFSYFGNDVLTAETKTDEEVRIEYLSVLFSNPCLPPLISNLSWLIPTALDKHFADNGYFMDVRYSR